MFKTTAFCYLLFLTVFGAFVNALPLEKRSTSMSVKSASQFCFYLPDEPGLSIGGTEGSAVKFCTQADLASPSAKQFPSGFIASAHYKSTSTYQQVTGRINREKYELSASDGGGQYDYKNEVGTLCNGHSYWVNLVEPDIERFCIRCCSNKSDCNIGRSEYGCESVIPGDYS